MSNPDLEMARLLMQVEKTLDVIEDQMECESQMTMGGKS